MWCGPKTVVRPACQELANVDNNGSLGHNGPKPISFLIQNLQPGLKCGGKEGHETCIGMGAQPKLIILDEIDLGILCNAQVAVGSLKKRLQETRGQA